MAFMEPEIYRGEAYVVDGPNGTDYVPLDACGDLGPGVPIPCHSFEWDDTATGGSQGVGFRYDTPSEAEELALRELASRLADYIENRPETVWSIERRTGFLARMSAPGYMDATEWNLFDSEAEAEEYVRENYQDDDEEEEED